MREHIYRAWDNIRKEMHEFTLQDVFNGSVGNYEFDSINFDPEEVMAYTRLKDRNGKMIFEGDVLGSPTQPNMFVKWHEKGKWVVDYNTTKPYSSLYQHKPEKRCWVLGNIYENPELL